MGKKCTQAFRNLLVALCVLCSLFLPLYAESENRLGIRFYGSFLYTDTVPDALFFFSDIKKNDSFELRKALRNHDIDTLVLSSRGGSVWEGLSMAGIIHDKGLTTYVPKLGLEGRGDCASACSFMFFAGKTREAEGGVGVHQFYSGSASESAEVEETEEIAQFTVSEIIGFLNEFETPPFVFERMFQQSKMYYFDNNEMKKIARTVTPLKQEQRSEIEGFINEFLIELASFEEEEASEAEQKSEPEKSPPQKQQPAKEDADTDTQKQIVQNIQTELNRLNCNAGLADGVIGNGTKSALARYAIAAGKFIDEVMLQDQELLLELRESQITCKLPSKSYAQNLVCSGREDPGYPSLAKLKIYDFLKEPLFSRIYSIEYCLSNGACQEGSFKRSKNTNLNGDSVHLFWEINKVDPIGVRWFFKKQKEQLEFSEVARVGADKVRMEYTLNKCILNSNTTNTATQKTYTTNPKSLASSYKFETCARVSNKKECSTGNLKLRRLKGGEYEFEEETNSPEFFYGEIKVNGSEVELQMVDFIEGVAVPLKGTGTIRKNTNEIIFPFSDDQVIKTFGKAGIDLKNGEITDLTIRWF